MPHVVDFRWFGRMKAMSNAFTIGEDGEKCGYLVRSNFGGDLHSLSVRQLSVDAGANGNRPWKLFSNQLDSGFVGQHGGARFALIHSTVGQHWRVSSSNRLQSFGGRVVAEDLDCRLDAVARGGRALAVPRLGHSVDHIDVQRLEAITGEVEMPQTSEPCFLSNPHMDPWKPVQDALNF